MTRDDVARAQYHRLLSQGVDVRSYAAQLSSRENDTLRPVINYSQLLETVATQPDQVPDQGAANNLKWAMALFALLLISFVGAGAIMNDRPAPRAAAAAAAPPPPAMPAQVMPVATPVATTARVVAVAPARPVVAAPPVVIAAPLQPAAPVAVAPKATAPIAPKVKPVGFVRPAPRAATPPVVRPDPPARPAAAPTSDAAKREETRKKAMDTLVRASAETSL